MKLYNTILITALSLSIVTSCGSEDKKKENKKETKKEEKSSAIIVTEENFPQAYTNLRMSMIAERAGGVNKFIAMPTPSSKPEEQMVVRMNRDTYYSSSVIDMTGDVFITVPETDQYVSIQIVDENHETQPMIYGSGRHKITAKTDHAFVIVRALDDDTRANLVIEATENDPFETKEWDMDSFKAMEKIGNEEFLKGYDQSKAFGNSESGQTPHMNFVGAAGGWGGAMAVDNIYQTSNFFDAEGCYEMTFKDPGNKYFWSATVYNENGYMFNDVANISSEMKVIKNDDGTITVRFGCEGEPNNIPIKEGNTTGKFNVLIRHYGPSDAVRNNEEGFNPVMNIQKVDK